MAGGSRSAGRTGPSPVMAWPSSRLRPPSRHAPAIWQRRRQRANTIGFTCTAFIAALVMLACQIGRVEASGCKVDHCTEQFQQAASVSGFRRGFAHSSIFCAILRQYSDCLRSTARSCRGNLTYHTTIILVNNWNGEFNCSYVGTSTATPPTVKDGPARSKAEDNRQQQQHAGFNKGDDQHGVGGAAERFEPITKVYRPDKATGNSGYQSASANTACAYHGRPEVTHCSFYGDPHLVTFKGEFQTCKVAGAWPLIDNAYLAVSVTNEAVVPGSAATATTKITIIIKGGSDCAPERTYEAAVDSVPASFVDGSQWGGPVGAAQNLATVAGSAEHLVPVRIVEKEAGRHVEIHARHLGATLVVRQVGRYLTFAARMPRDIAEQGASREGLQLCVKGCPASERIDIYRALTGGPPPSSGRFHRQSDNSFKGMHREAALALCREYNLTDYYLDSCMFDLITTGDPSFSLAASRAQADFMALLPDASNRLTNRTKPLTWSASSASQGSLSSSASARASFFQSPLTVREAHGPGRPYLAAMLVFIWSLMSLLNLL